MLFFGNASQALTPGPVQMLVVLAILWWVVGRKFQQARNPHRAQRLRDLIALVFVWVWVFSTPGLANLALGQLEGPVYTTVSPRDEAPLYVVAGAGTPAQANGLAYDQLTLAGWRRTTAAVGHWQKTGGKILFVGGLGRQPDPATNSIASAMANLAIELGVPASAIQASGHSTANTYDDMKAAHGPVSAYRGPAYLITSAAHMPRTMAVAEALGMSLKPLPCDWQQLQNPGWRAWLPNNGGPQLWQTSIYELLGLFVYSWRGWL